MDDSDYPNTRVEKEYYRYKIYDPEKAVHITRISELTQSSDGQEINSTDFLARLTLPDGTTREFNKDSIQERNVVKTDDNFFSRLMNGANNEVQEKYLAIPGIVPGAILEVQFARTRNRPTLFEHVFQKVGIPVRHVDFTLHIADTSDYIPRPFVLNNATYHAELKPDIKKGVIRLTADNLPPLYVEPLSPPVLDRALAIAGSYITINAQFRFHHLDRSVRVNKEGGAWGNFATRMSMIAADSTEYWNQFDGLAAKLTAGAKTQTEKAARIQAFVHQRFIEYLRFVRPNRHYLLYYYSAEPDEVIDFEKHPDSYISPTDFLWVAIGLYKSAGLETQTILLPDNNRISFDPTMSSEAFLPETCARVKVDGVWKFSYPHTALPLPLGMLPPANVGRQGLIAQINKTEFIDIPPSKAEESVVTDSGSFELRADGGLSGYCERTYVGLPGIFQKARMRNLPPERIERAFDRLLKTEFKADRISVSSVEGMDSADAALVVRYRIEWNDYATLTKSRIIFVPSVFESHRTPAFGLATRHNDITFPFPVTSVETFSLHLPDGYRLEAPAAPPSIPGPNLSLTYRVTYAKSTKTLSTTRTRVTRLVRVDQADYPALKGWFDHEALLDSHELVLVKDLPAPTPIPAAVPAPAPVAPSPSSPAKVE